MSRSRPARLRAGWPDEGALRRDPARRRERDRARFAARDSSRMAAACSPSSAADRWARRQSIAWPAGARPRSRCSTPQRRCCRASSSRRHSYSEQLLCAPHDRTAAARLWPRCATPQLLSAPRPAEGFQAPDRPPMIPALAGQPAATVGAVARGYGVKWSGPACGGRSARQLLRPCLRLRTAGAETLESALAQAYRNNPTLNAQRAAAARDR